MTLTKVVANKVTIQNLASFLVLAFSIGVAYNSLANDSSLAKAERKEIKERLKKAESAVIETNLSINTIQSDQRHIKEDIEGQKELLLQILKNTKGDL